MARQLLVLWGMRRIITFALMTLMLTGGVALADRDHRGNRGRHHDRVRDTSHRSGGVHVRDRRVNRNYRVDRSRQRVDRNRYRYRVNPGHRIDRTRHRRVRVNRRPVYVNNGRYVFHGGVTRAYRRPVIRQRYFNYRYRPQIIIENYDPVPGYIWVAGSWNWNGREWLWTSGYWAPDPNYTYNYYDSYDGRYYNSY